MAIRNIVTLEDEILTKKCRPVVSFDGRLAELLDDMAETLKDVDGVGLAAPQVGILRRVVVIHTEDEIIEMVNPEIIAQSGEQRESEGCLSCPGMYGITVRPMNVTVRAQDRDGNWFETEGEGLKARCMCHELDHLDGILLIDSAIELYDVDDDDE